eukprot:9314711-Pyramimonas_sp.AAC.1
MNRRLAEIGQYWSLFGQLVTIGHLAHLREHHHLRRRAGGGLLQWRRVVVCVPARAPVDVR